MVFGECGKGEGSEALIAQRLKLKAESSKQEAAES